MSPHLVIVIVVIVNISGAANGSKSTMTRRSICKEKIAWRGEGI